MIGDRLQAVQISCPRCGASAQELIECEGCKSIGCVKCIAKRNKQWVCGDCKDGTQYGSQPSSQSAESALASMFG